MTTSADRLVTWCAQRHVTRWAGYAVGLLIAIDLWT